MNRILLLLALMGAGQVVHAQYVYTIKADSVKITNSCDTAELIIENHTQNVPGFLFNKGRGRTEFRRGLIDLSDNVYLIGSDTLNFNKILDGAFFKQGGNSFGTTALLGTKDNYPLTFVQNGVEKGRLENGGNWLFNTTQDKGYLAQFNGNIWAAGSINVDGKINIAIVPSSPGNNSISIGRDMSVNSPNNMSAIGIGQFCTVTASGLHAFGAGNYNHVSDGIGILGNTDRGIALGMGSFAHPKSVAMSFESVSTGENQFVCGGPDHVDAYGNQWTNAIYNVYFGSGVQRNNVAGSGLSFTINGSGGYGSNYGGGNITIAGGKGTGAGAPGSIVFATAQPVSAGATLQDLTERARFDANGNLGIGVSTPSAMLHVSGTGRFDNTVTTTGHRSAIRTVSGNTALGDTDEYVFVNAAADLTVTLPNATGRDGQTYTIKKVNDSNTVTITSNSSQLIDGTNSYSLISRWAYVTVVANEGSWMIVSASQNQ